MIGRFWVAYNTEEQIYNYATVEETNKLCTQYTGVLSQSLSGIISQWRNMVIGHPERNNL